MKTWQPVQKTEPGAALGSTLTSGQQALILWAHPHLSLDQVRRGWWAQRDVPAGPGPLGAPRRS